MDLSILKNANDNMITSLTMKTVEDKKRFFNAMNAADESIQDNLNDEITICDYIAHTIQIEGEEAVRIVLIDKDGKSYASVSTGITQSLTKILAIFGQPEEWGDGLTVRFLEKKSSSNSKNKFLTLELI